MTVLLDDFIVMSLGHGPMDRQQIRGLAWMHRYECSSEDVIVALTRLESAKRVEHVPYRHLWRLPAETPMEERKSDEPTAASIIAAAQKRHNRRRNDSATPH
jgi:hypothetical protein